MVKRISIEREFALWKAGRPLGAGETSDFRKVVDAHKDSVEGLTCTDTEVAHNSIELKFSLLPPDGFRVPMTAARKQIEQLAAEQALTVFWTNQPLHAPAGHNEYFTTLAFPSLVNHFVHGNSAHIHNEVEPGKGIHLYRQLNALAPWFIMNSRQRGQIDRVKLIAAFRDSMRELLLPQDLRTMDDYREYMISASSEAHDILRGNGNLEKARMRFGRMFPDGANISLTPDKVFHLARFRPDLVLQNGNISVEFRALDGMRHLSRELEIIDIALASFRRAIDHPEIAPIATVRNFYEELSTRSKAYRIAEEFIQETYKDDTGLYLEAANAGR